MNTKKEKVFEPAVHLVNNELGGLQKGILWFYKYFSIIVTVITAYWLLVHYNVLSIRFDSIAYLYALLIMFHRVVLLVHFIRFYSDYKKNQNTVYRKSLIKNIYYAIGSWLITLIIAYGVNYVIMGIPNWYLMLPEVALFTVFSDILALFS